MRRGFPGFENAYARSGSITTALREFGVEDYFRRSTLISARHAQASDLADLRLSPGAIVLVTTYVNVDQRLDPDPVLADPLRRRSRRAFRDLRSVAMLQATSRYRRYFSFITQTPFHSPSGGFARGCGSGRYTSPTARRPG